MKINYLIRSFPNKTETFIAHHVRFLLEKKMLNQFFTKSFKKDEELFDGIVSDIKPYLIKYPRVINIKDRLSYLISFLKKPNYILVWFKYIFKFKDIRFKNIYDILYYSKLEEKHIIHVQFNTSLTDLKRFTEIKFLNNLKIIVTFHGFDAFRLSSNLYQREYKSFYDKNVCFVTVNSIYLKNHLIKVGINAKKIKVIPVGINLEEIPVDTKERDIKNNPFKLISVGRLIQLKGHEYAIRAVASLKNKGFEVEYIIIGSGLPDYENYLQKLITELGCEREIKMLGYKNQDQIKMLSSNYNLFLMPSTYDDNTLRCEALGLAAIEAQAMGLPVVGFNTGGLKEAVINHKTGLIVEDRNIEAITDAIIQILKDQDKYNRYSKNAKDYALANFNNNNIFQEYSKLYKACHDS